MFTFAKRPRSIARTLVGVLAVGSACAAIAAAQDDTKKKKADEEKKTVFEDKQYDFKLVDPKDWSVAPPEAVSVPGKARRVYTPDNKTSIVAFMQEPGQALTARVLLDASVSGMKQLGCEIKSQKIRDVSKMRAMWMIAVGDGTGGALTGNGDVKTLQHWVAIPREKDIVVLLLTTPESDYETYKPVFDKLVRTAEIGGKQTDEQGESK